MSKGAWKPTRGLKWYRLQRKLTQADLAAQLGVLTKKVNAWERWTAAPTEAEQERLAAVLSCPREHLLQLADAEIEVEVLRMEGGKKGAGRPKKWKGTD